MRNRPALYIRIDGVGGENTATKTLNATVASGRKYCVTVIFVDGRVEGRILALDVGKRRIGLAVSDGLNITAQGLPTLQRTTIREDLKQLAELVAEREVRLLLVGDPLHMSGDQSRQAQYIRDFAARLGEKAAVPVRFWDERLTTVQAQRVLKESGISIEKRARAVDQLSAVILLESYLDSLPAANE